MAEPTNARGSPKNRTRRKTSTAQEIQAGLNLAEQANAASFISGIEDALRQVSQTKREVSGKQEEWMQCRGREGRGDGFVVQCQCGDDVRRGGGGGAAMWGCLVRMTKEMGRGWQWPPPEATRCLSVVTPPPGACVDVVCTAAVCAVTQQLRVFCRHFVEVGGGSADWGWRWGKASKAARESARVFVWHGALSRSQQKGTTANANRRIGKIW
jgi:hypothetical protein